MKTNINPVVSKNKTKKLTKKYKKIFTVFSKNYDWDNPEIPRSKEFQTLVHSYIKEELAKRGMSLMDSSTSFGYCEYSGYAVDPENAMYCYISTGDYRYNVMGPWQDHILIRAAYGKPQDCQKAQNHYCKLENIGEAVATLCKEGSYNGN